MQIWYTKQKIVRYNRMKKALMASVLSVFLGVGVLFGGCGNNTIPNDLSEINIQITELQQQITSLTQTILELQTRLNQAEQNQQELLLDLTTAQGQLLELQEQVFGKVNNYYQINEIFTYTVNGIKYFDFQVTKAFLPSSSYHRVDFNFNSNIENADITNPIFDISFYLYNPIDSQSYLFEEVTNQNMYTIGIPDDLRQGLLFVYIGNTLSVVYELNFV